MLNQLKLILGELFRIWRAISAHTALPLGGLFITRLSLLFFDLHGRLRERGRSPRLGIAIVVDMILPVN